MAERTSSMQAPSDIGRIAKRFDHKMSNFIAQEVITFVSVYSLVVWRDMLTPEEWPLWLLLVRCSRLLIQRATTREDRDEFKRLIFRYVRLFESFYGERACKPNHHMATHITFYLGLYGQRMHLGALHGNGIMVFWDEHQLMDIHLNSPP
jgi:hypothetical protein